MPVHHPHCGAMQIPRAACGCTAGTKKRAPSKFTALQIFKGVLRSELRDIEQALRLGRERSIKRQRLVYDAAFGSLERLKTMVA